MRISIAIAVLTVSVISQQGEKWFFQKYGDGPTGADAVDAGDVHVCKTQPNLVAWDARQDTCKSNLDCGTAFCISAKDGDDGTPYNKCGCGDFERMYNHEYVTVCSCDHSDSVESCLPVWEKSIMCKFACKNCYSCEEKTGSECAKDALCMVDAATSKCVTKYKLEKHCNSLPAASCETDKKCRWTGAKCEDRMEVAQTGDRCPQGTLRKQDFYMGKPGNFFDTCVGHNLIIHHCKYYEWDGDSCKTCEVMYRLGMVALEDGTGAIKQNAICVKETNLSNQRCEVFVHAHCQSVSTNVQENCNSETAELEGHHKCARCREGYEWPIDSDGKVNHYKCEPEYVENSDDFPLLLGAATAFMGGAFVVGVKMLLLGFKLNKTVNDVEFETN